MTERLTADEVNSMDTDIYRAARLAYRLGRQDQQRILEHRLRKHFDSDVQAKQIRDLAAGMTDDLVDFHAIVPRVGIVVPRTQRSGNRVRERGR